MANKGDYDLLLIGIGESIYEGTLLGKLFGFTTNIINPEKLLHTVTGKDEQSPFDERTTQIVSKTHIPVGVFVNKNLQKTERVFIPVFDGKDTFLIAYAQKLIHNTGSQVIVLDSAGQIKNNADMKEKIRAIEQSAPNHISLTNEHVLEKDFLKQQDLMLISIDSWKKLVETKSVWLSDIPSTLIIYDKQNA